MARPKLPPDLARPLKRLQRALADLDSALAEYDHHHRQCQTEWTNDVNNAEGDLDPDEWLVASGWADVPVLTFDQAATLARALDEPGLGITQVATMIRDRAFVSARLRFPTDKTAVVEGVGTLERCLKGAKKVWEGKRIVSVVAARIADEAIDTTTGEIKPPAVIANEVAQALSDVAGLGNASQSFRKTEIEALGLNASDYSEQFDGTPSVRFT